MPRNLVHILHNILHYCTHRLQRAELDASVIFRIMNPADEGISCQADGAFWSFQGIVAASHYNAQSVSAAATTNALLP